MISVIREVCIFMIIAQAVLYFVPGSSYMKYVRILAGIMVILKIMEPVFGLLMDEGKAQEIQNRVEMLEKVIDESRGELRIEENYINIYEEIEEELKVQLEKCDDRYDIVSVDIVSADIKEWTKQEEEGLQFGVGRERIIITLKEKDANGKELIRIAPINLEDKKSDKQKEDAELKELYRKCIGVDAERIEIRMK